MLEQEPAVTAFSYTLVLVLPEDHGVWEELTTIERLRRQDEAIDAELKRLLLLMSTLAQRGPRGCRAFAMLFWDMGEPFDPPNCAQNACEVEMAFCTTPYGSSSADW